MIIERTARAIGILVSALVELQKSVLTFKLLGFIVLDIVSNIKQLEGDIILI